VKKAGEPERRVAVRTSKDRKVGLMRDPDTGDWRTIPEADEVVVAVQAQDDPNLAEVFGFDPEVLIRAFDALAAKALAKKSREKALKSPVFIALDHQLDDPHELSSNQKKVQLVDDRAAQTAEDGG
jgi:hypothetical protein